MKSQYIKSGPSWVLPTAFSSSAVKIIVGLFLMAILVGCAGQKEKDRFSTGSNEALPRQTGDPVQEPTQAPSLTEVPVIQQQSPQTAALVELRGLVEIRGDDGKWMSIQNNSLVQAHQQVRTGEMSSITLKFYDGSEVRLGPDSELSLDELEANKDGPRIVSLTQLIGESDHQVAASSVPGSQYVVNTPSGQVTAGRARFHLYVGPTKFVRFDVVEGAMEVSNFGSSVFVVAGQSITCGTGLTPSGPFFRDEGEGRVERVGASWRIAGSTYHTNGNTVTAGNPQVGDWVRYEALVQLDGTRSVYRISLLQREQKNQFELRGKVEEITSTQWVTAGSAVHINEATLIDAAIQVGDAVKVIGTILPGETLVATRIHQSVDFAGLNFDITGVVQAISDTTWIISGIPIWVEAATEIESGIAVGSVVHAQGKIQDSGIRLAQNVRQAEDDGREFSFAGQVEGINPWGVSGISFETESDTQIDAQIGLGDQVRVNGRILEDGHWLARNIQRLELVTPNEIDFWGVVNETKPWVVSGLSLLEHESVIIQGKVSVSRLVHVKGLVRSDGTLVAQEIVGQDQRQGCLSLTSAVRQISSNKIVLFNWQVIRLGGGVNIQGEIKVASVVLASGCVGEDGNLLVSNVIVIAQLDELPAVK